MAAEQVGRRVRWRATASLAAIVLLSAGSLALWGWTHHRVETHIYSASDFGGYVGANRKRLPDKPIQRASEAYAAGRYAEAEQIANEIIESSEPRQAWVRPVPAGGYAPQCGVRPPTPQSWGTSDAGGGARVNGVGSERKPIQSPKSKTQNAVQALLARRILAYSAARQGKYAEAKARFGALRQAAYESPEHGRQRVAVGEVAPTLEEEGAFQQAVCTSALGDKRAAEAELDGFMRDYPQSILVHAAVKRIGRMHGGDVPKDAEAIWKQAMAVQKAADEKERRDRALCGPECLAELLRRSASREGAKTRRGAKGVNGSSLAQSSQRTQRDARESSGSVGAVLMPAGQTSQQPIRAVRPATSNQQLVTVAALAVEMHTSGEGSSVAAMVATAAKHGLKLEGVSMTMKGLAKQRLPLIALIAPGHYVLVESLVRAAANPLAPTAITVWDPDAKGAGEPGRRSYSAAEWEKVWNGVALR